MNDFEISRLAHVEALLDDAKRRLAEAELRVKELEGDNSVLRLQIAAKRSTWAEET